MLTFKFIQQILIETVFPHRKFKWLYITKTHPFYPGYLLRRFVSTMYMNSLLGVAFLFFLTYLIIESQTAGEMDTCNTFIRDMEMNDRKNKKSLGNVAQPMKFEDCIKLCANDILCKSIFYHRENSECESAQHYATKNTSEMAEGWNYFEKFPCCKSGWMRFQKHCYLFKKGEFNLTEAQELCEKEGAYMVEIISFTVEEFLKRKMKKDALVNTWTGGRNHQGQWKWAHSGQPFGYSNWYHTDPSGDGIAMTYSLFYSPGYWADIPSSSRRNVICQSD